VVTSSGNNDEKAFCSRYCDVQTLDILQKAHRVGSDEGDDDNLTLPTLKPLDGSNLNAVEQRTLLLENRLDVIRLSLVRRNNENVFGAHTRFASASGRHQLGGIFYSCQRLLVVEERVASE